MHQYYPLLLSTHLFTGFSSEELAQLLPTLPTTLKQYQKGDTLLFSGSTSSEIGVVLTGEIEAAKHSRAGQRFTVTRMGAGGVFGDVLSAASTGSPVTITTPTGCNVLLIAYPPLLSGNPTALQRRLLQNLVRVVSDKYFQLHNRIELLLLRSLRGRIAAYLLSEAEHQNTPIFTIPFTRTALAAYLGCDRSAMVREISRMSNDGLLETQGPTFQLLNMEALRAAAQ